MSVVGSRSRAGAASFLPGQERPNPNSCDSRISRDSLNLGDLISLEVSALLGEVAIMKDLVKPFEKSSDFDFGEDLAVRIRLR